MSDVQFGRYRVIAPIARGGMADVFAGELVGEGGFSRPVAIKSIRPDLVEDPAYVTMFLDEARLAANVQSPHVVNTLDLGRTDQGVPFMVMDLVIGATVGQLLRALRPQPLPLSFAVEILIQALRGLEDAHSALSPRGDPLRIVHRDIAPKNILVGIDGRTRIMDFGIAHAVERLTRTSTGQVKGTVRYLSPEQADLQPVDQRSDIFSMGAVAFEMLTGTRLFDGRGMIDIYAQVMRQEIPDVRHYVPELPPGLARVVARALERDRERRWQRAGDFAHALASENIDRPTTQELRSFVRTNLPPRVRELSVRLRENANAGVPRPRSIEIDLDFDLGDDDEPTSAARRPPAPAPAMPSPRGHADEREATVPRKRIPSATAPRAPAANTTVEAARRSQPAPPTRSRARSGLGWLLVLAVLVTLAGVGYLLARGGILAGPSGATAPERESSGR